MRCALTVIGIDLVLNANEMMISRVIGPGLRTFGSSRVIFRPLCLFVQILRVYVVAS